MENAPTSHRVALLGLLFLSTLTGCRKDVGPAQWDIDVLGPLFTTRLTIANLIPDSLQQIGSNGAITLVYSEELFTLELDTLLSIPDTLFRYPYAFPLPPGDTFDLPAGFPVISENNLIRFNLADLQLRDLHIREGTLELHMRNKIGSRVNGSFGLPGAQFSDGSNTLVTSVDAGSPSSPSFSTLVRDLSGARFDLRGPTFSDVNTLASSVSAELDPTGSGAVVTNQDSVVIEASYRSIVPSYARGYFGNRSVESGEVRTPFSLFEDFVSGTLDLDQVQLRLHVKNGVGMDIRIRLNEFQAVNTRTGATVDLMGSIMQGPINLNRALDHGGGPTPTLYERTLDNTNSNVDAFVETLPNELLYNVDVELNPLGNISNGNDFVYYESAVSAELDLEVPLSLIATDLVLENIVKPDLPGTAEHPLLQNGTMHLFATNGFPFAANVILDIVDLDRNVLSSAPVSGGITAGVLGAGQTVTATTNSEMHVDLTEEQIDMLYGDGRFRIRVVFNTADQTEHVHLLERYAMDLQFTVGARYMVNGGE